jgi:hypothetical protein
MEQRGAKHLIKENNMFNVKITNAENNLCQYASVLYAEVKIKIPGSAIASEIRVALPQGMFIVERGSEVRIIDQISGKEEVYVVDYEAPAAEA